jgi:TolB-like protein
VSDRAPHSSGWQRFLAEARRRKVHRVAAIYVAVGIPLLEAADLLAPVLLLPEWAYRVLGAVVLVGFPIALLASWTFDLTWAGIERTEPLPRPAASHGTSRDVSGISLEESGKEAPSKDVSLASAPTEGAEASPTHVPQTGSTAAGTKQPRRQIVFAVLTAATLVMGGLGWRIATPQTVELDEQTIAILPFRVSADPSLDYLGEGLMDLLAAQLPGDVGPRVLDPATVLNRLEGRAASEAGAVPRRDAIELARELGASGVLLGSVVGTTDRIVADATLFDSRSGREAARLRADAPEDSLRALVDRMALELLAQTAGDEPRLATELTESLEALRAYLRGAALARQGELYPAMDELEAALAIDSTFAKAAIYLNGVACWTFECGGPRAQRAARLAWEHRHRLSDYDRFWLEADRGVSSPAERLAIRQRLVATRPDDPAAWYRLAWTTYQYGAWLGVEDSEALAAEHLRRSLDLGAPLRGTVLNAGFVFYEDGDTANLRRISDEYLEGAPSSDISDWVRWLLATATGDNATVRAVTARMPQTTPEAATRFLRFASLTGDGIESADSAAAEVRRQIQRVTATNLLDAAIELQIYQTNRGWARAARRTRDEWGGGRSDVTVGQWLWGGIESPDLDQAMLALWAEGTSETAIRPAGRAIREFYRCLVGLAQLRRDFDLPANPDRSVRDPMAADPRNSNEPYFRRTADMCAALLDAWHAVEEGRPDAASLVARADSIQRGSANMYVAMTHGAPIELAWLKERLGDLPGALSTIRRQVRGAFVILFTATRVREEGRLAVLNGDVEGAIAAYEHYLALRSDPDPELEAEAAEVRAEYEQLLDRQ